MAALDARRRGGGSPLLHCTNNAPDKQPGVGSPMSMHGHPTNADTKPAVSAWTSKQREILTAGGPCRVIVTVHEAKGGMRRLECQMIEV